MGLSAFGRLAHDQLDRADLGLDLHRARAGEAELAPRGAVRDRQRAEQRRLAPDAADQADHLVEPVADEDRRLLVEVA